MIVARQIIQLVRQISSVMIYSESVLDGGLKRVSREFWLRCHAIEENLNGFALAPHIRVIHKGEQPQHGLPTRHN
jgi:hypothetical protein